MKYLRDPVWGFIGVVVAILSLIIAIIVSFNPVNITNTPLITKTDPTPTINITQTATSMLTPNNPSPPYRIGSGVLVFADPLTQEGGSQWRSSSGNGETCQFINRAYHVSEQRNGYLRYCHASGTFSNFTFEVQLTIIQGDCGGLVFRDDRQGHFYEFRICQSGRYKVAKYVNVSGSNTINLQSGTSSAINTEPDQQNKIAVEAYGSIMTFYVNWQQIGQLQDSSYTSGSIALITDAGSNATEVAYTTAKLWTL